jgi:hypothetical protein
VKNELRKMLETGDDGRAFTDAVLLQASGALYRRRQAAEASTRTWGWLERWSRPLIVVTLAAAAAAVALPVVHRPASIGPEPVAEATLLADPQPDIMLAVTYAPRSR